MLGLSPAWRDAVRTRRKVEKRKRMNTGWLTIAVWQGRWQSSNISHQIRATGPDLLPHARSYWTPEPVGLSVSENRRVVRAPTSLNTRFLNPTRPGLIKSGVKPPHSLFLASHFFPFSCAEGASGASRVRPQSRDGVVRIIGQHFHIDHHTGTLEHAAAVGGEVTEAEILPGIAIALRECVDRFES